MKKTIIREYHLDEESIKEALRLEGDIQGMELWQGLTPTEEEEGMCHANVRWQITTKEIREEDSMSTKNGMEEKKPHADVFIERAGNITKHGIEAIRAVAGTDEEYKAYVDKYSTKEVKENE